MTLGRQEKGRLIAKFLSEEGHDVPITNAVERAAEQLRQSGDVSLLARIKEQDPDAAFLLAYELASLHRNELTHAGLKGAVLDILESGIDRSESGDQLTERTRMVSDITGRGVVEHTWVDEMGIDRLARAVSRKPERSWTTEGRDWKGKVYRDDALNKRK